MKGVDDERLRLMAEERCCHDAATQMAMSAARSCADVHHSHEAAAQAAESAVRLLAKDRRQHEATKLATMSPMRSPLTGIEQMFSDVRENIGLVCAESASLVVINRSTCTTVDDSTAKFLRALEITAQKNDKAFAAYEQRVMAMTEVPSKSISNMQAKLQGSFDRMKYLEKRFRTFRDSLLLT